MRRRVMDRSRRLFTIALTAMLMAAAFFAVVDIAGSSVYADTGSGDSGYTVIIYYNDDNVRSVRGGQHRHDI